MKTLTKAELCNELGIEPNAEHWESAAVLIFGVRREWPLPVDTSADAWMRWSKIVADVTADLRAAPDESTLATVLAYELESTLRHFYSSVASSNEQRLRD